MSNNASVPARLILVFGAALAWAIPRPATAGLLDGYSGAFALTPAQMAFTEGQVGATNPSFTFNNVPTYGTLSIAYGPYFAGQAYLFDPNSNPIPTETSDKASNPLSLASDPNLVAAIEDDSSAPPASSPAIGGTPTGFSSFVGPVAIRFSIPVQGVELTVGDLANANQVILEAFAADGMSLGTLSNLGLGYEQFDVHATGGLISGISLRSADNQSPTYAGVSDVGVYQAAAAAVPAPGSTALLAAGAGLFWFRRSRR